ncbi:BREX system serine/threonine kinase PglW [Streptomyces sp. TS71-3]|uniref:BREX system serine/threonine kinase PglW n=1 Tax=Streptomyces sp. TS71-3 TaxID=2733862 RepID=UPI001AFE3A5C|nr:BREX system serine/threonine kinase PglW [Streptomyces sp. TS71-3]GHJ36009.1 protein kinase [Streptomyces sp. TS71-3]
MRDGRWTTVTESEFDHERRGLEAIRAQLPDTEPWRAWSNFTFTAPSGHVREVDLLVVGRSGVFLVELKEWHGSVTSEMGTWVQTTPGGRRVSHGNPLHLANKKAKELAGLLRQQMTGPQHGQGVWVGEAVCFTNPSMRFRLPPHEQGGVHTVAGLAEMLNRPPQDERHRIDAPRSRAIETALKGIGIRRSDAAYKVGPYLLERKALDTGPTWSDYLARHEELPERARIRVYVPERGSDASLRESVERAARREAAILQRFRHPGVVRLKTYDGSGHSAGPALVFEYRPGTLRLDEYLLQYGDKLDILSRMALVRQLAETLRSAHSSRIHHRALAARSVHVIPRHHGAAGEEAAWLTPRLEISDWQVGAQRGNGSTPGGTRLAPTTLSLKHLSETSDPYLAPELTALNPDPVFLDVYGLGVLTYLLATGQPPAASQAELRARLEAGEGLRPSAVVDGLSEDIDELVQAATAYRPGQRLSTVDEFLEMLELVEDGLTAPAAPSATTAPETPEKDPLDAVPGDLLAGRWEVRRRLGTGSTSRAFLVRDLEAEARKTRPLAVLKVALSDSRGSILVSEAEVMRRLRPDSRIIRLVEQEPLRIGPRTVLALEYVGDERDEPADGAASSGSAGRVRRREETVARQLREVGRLPVDQLEAYGDYLFGAVDFLEGESVWHRDIKPDNIAIRIRPNRTRELVLIDFSLAGYPARNHEAGTEGYLDPFIGTLTRTAYDSHAERYAVAVTLYEMASGELPRWGDGSVLPRTTKPKDFPHPTIAADAFDAAIRDGLVGFFQKALHRDASERFPELKPMRDAWRKIFLDASQAAPSTHRSRHPETAAEDGRATLGEAEPLTAEQQREELARQVTRDTHLSAAGLTPPAESFLYGLNLTTVGQLLDYSRRKLLNAPGLGAKTRREVQQRQRQWGELLREAPVSPLTPQGRAEAKEELAQLTAAESAVLGILATKGTLSETSLRTLSLDTLATFFVPELNNNRSNHNKVEMVRLLLRLPDEHGELPPIGVWPKQKDVADVVGLSAGRIPQILKEERKRWQRQPAVRALRKEVMDLLVDLGRVAPVAEVADALVVRRGTQLPGRDQRRALALAAVRAVVEVEQLDPEAAEFQHQANRRATEESLGAGMLALDVRQDDAPDTPTAPALLQYATRLGRTADRLARLETLPTAATVLTELGALSPPPGAIEWDERRLVELAAAASQNAAATPRLEIYPRDLPLVRALRLTQAGLVPLIPGVPEEQQPGLRAEDVHERVRARFPELVVDNGRGGATHELPTGARLTKALRDAGFDLRLATREPVKTLRYLPTRLDSDSSYLTTGAMRRATALSAHVTRYADDPRIASAARAEDRLLASAGADGYRVLTVHRDQTREAVRELSSARIGAHEVSATVLFLEALHALVPPGTKPTWETLLKADAAEPGSRGALKFAEYARTAWGAVEPRVRGLLGDGEVSAGGAASARTGAPGSGPGGAGPSRSGPLLLTEAGVFARYDAMGVLDRLAEAARYGGRGLWLLVPGADPAREPKLGAVAVAYQAGLGEWISLPDAWVENAHRAGAGAAGGTAGSTGSAGSAASAGPASSAGSAGSSAGSTSTNTSTTSSGQSGRSEGDGE